MALRYDEIGEILKIIDSSSCEEFVLETEDIKLVVRRRSVNGPIPAVDPGSARQVQSAAAPAVPFTAERVAPKSAPAIAEQAGLHVVRAPMVGTFYRAPSPGAPPFVEIGARVKKADPLCIIEVMKLFTTIHAEIDGIVAEIGAENATLVEYGQMLFVMKPEK
jgi:acetyl-CoA carboxylase biotin carboxyl carrier protein